MSDQDPDDTTGDRSADERPKDNASGDESTPTTPSPRPRSAASRARRIGGVAAAPRPDADDAKADAKGDAPTVDIGKKTSKAAAKPADKTGGKSDTKSDGKSDTKSDGKSGRKVAGKPTKATKATGDDTADKPAVAAMTFSIPGWVRWAPGFVFAAAAVVFLSLFAVAQFGGDDAPDSTSSKTRQEVLASAKTCLATLNTYRYDQLAQAEAAGVRCTTGQITTAYKRTVSTILRKNAPPLKAVQLAKINTAGIESVTQNGKQWTVLAYGQLNITTANSGKQGRVDPFAVVARLQQVKGKWVISKIDTVSSASP